MLAAPMLIIRSGNHRCRLSVSKTSASWSASSTRPAGIHPLGHLSQSAQQPAAQQVRHFHPAPAQHPGRRLDGQHHRHLQRRHRVLQQTLLRLGPVRRAAQPGSGGPGRLHARGRAQAVGVLPQFPEPVDVFHILGWTSTPTTAPSAACVSAAGVTMRPSSNRKNTCWRGSSRTERSIKLHMQLNRIETERNLYAGAVDQMAVGTIILDDTGKVLQTNRWPSACCRKRTASSRSMMGCRSAAPGIPRSFVAWCARPCSRRRATWRRWSRPCASSALRACRPGHHRAFSTAVGLERGQTMPDRGHFHQRPGAAILGAPGDRPRPVRLHPGRNPVGDAAGQRPDLDEASEELGISRNTSRAHLRSTFSKTGVTRQTMLVRLILRSVATLG